MAKITYILFNLLMCKMNVGCAVLFISPQSIIIIVACTFVHAIACVNVDIGLC